VVNSDMWVGNKFNLAREDEDPRLNDRDWDLKQFIIRRKLQKRRQMVWIRAASVPTHILSHEHN
jgi:hypothetical protein